MKTHARDNRRAWYDPRLKTWTYWTVDADGNQVAEVEYDYDRKRVMGWLRTGEFPFGVSKAVK